jgi:phage terminase small subunit
MTLQPDEGATPLGNSQHEAFCHHYAAVHNASAAAERAGYSRKTAGQQGHRLLKDAKIRARVEYLTAQALVNADVEAADVVRELARVGYSDVWNYAIDESGNVTLAPGAPSGASRAVSAIKRKTRTSVTKDGESVTETTTEIRLWPKVDALEKLARYKDIFPSDRRGSATEPLEIIIRRSPRA